MTAAWDRAWVGVPCTFERLIQWGDEVFSAEPGGCRGFGRLGDQQETPEVIRSIIGILENLIPVDQSERPGM